MTLRTPDVVATFALSLAIALLAGDCRAQQGDTGAAAESVDRREPRQGSVDAERRLRAAIRLNPEEPAFHAELADNLWAQERREEAIRSYVTAARLMPGDTAALGRLARAFLAVGRWPEAESAFRDLARLAPDDRAARAGLGEALAAQGRTAEANEAFAAAERPRIRESERARAARAPPLVDWIVRVITVAAAVVLVLAGVVVLLPVLAGIVALLVVAPLELLRRRSDSPLPPPG